MCAGTWKGMGGGAGRFVWGGSQALHFVARNKCKAHARRQEGSQAARSAVFLHPAFAFVQE